MESNELYFLQGTFEDNNYPSLKKLFQEKTISHIAVGEEFGMIIARTAFPIIFAVVKLHTRSNTFQDVTVAFK